MRAEENALERFIMLGVAIVALAASESGSAAQVQASRNVAMTSVSCGNAHRSIDDSSSHVSMSGLGTKLTGIATKKDRIPDFIRPVDGHEIVSLCANDTDGDAGAINFAVTVGAIVKAAADGIVVYAGGLTGFGDVVVIRHKAGWITAYSCEGRLLVKRGDKTLRGRPIAVVGHAVIANFPQLHFEMRRGEKSLNPRDYLPDETL
jgi:septal ring factor EnvC (AmiA/AmiB activator)